MKTSESACHAPFAGTPHADADRLAFVDLLRGFAILGVVSVHTRQSWFADIPQWFRTFVDLGRYGVDLFFIVSAFTLARSCGKSTLGAFFLRRWFRIAPIYYLGILIYGMVPCLLGWSEPPLATLVVTNLVFLNGWWPGQTSGLVPGGWSISAEIAFYVLLPFAVRHITGLKQAVLLYLGLLLAVVPLEAIALKILSHYGAGSPSVDDMLLYCPLWHVPTFVLGLVLHHARPLVSPVLRWPLIIGGTAAFLCAPVTVDGWHLPRCLAVSVPLFAVALGVAVGTFHLRRPPFTWLRHLGTISYSVYLMHFWVLEAVVILATGIFVPLDASGGTMFAVSLIGTLTITTIVAALSRRYIEEPALRLSDRLRKRRSSPQR